MSKQDMRWILLAGLGLICSLPPFRFGWIAFVALLPLFYFLENKSFKQAFWGGYAVGVLWIAGTLYWIGWATITGMIGATLYLPIYPALFCGIQCRFNRRWGVRALFLAPLLWAAVEVLMTRGPLGFPWNLLAVSQTHQPVLIQFVSILGPYFAGFWIVLINATLYILSTDRRAGTVQAGGVALVLLLGVPLVHGVVAMRSQSAGMPLSVALIQGNIDPYKKWTPSFVDTNFVVYEALTHSMRGANPDLVVWPETATPCYLRYRFHYLNIVREIADSMRASILTGSPDYEWGEDDRAASFNSALLVQPQSRIVQRYHKKHLVPFSERVPLVDRIPSFYEFLRKINLDVGTYHPGDSSFVFHMHATHRKEPVRFAAAICFDSVFPNHVREYFDKGAQFLVIITNDGWFGRTSGPHQHARIAVLRAIENRTWVARCANTGITCYVDPKGRMLDQTKLYTEDAIARTIQLTDERTVYNRWGHWIEEMFVLLAALFMVLSFMSRRHT